MKVETKLARVFSTLADEEKKTESTAAAVLAIVKDEQITNLEKFDEAVCAAYEANGWNAKAGRPLADAKTESVPATVRTYVSWVRAAFHAGLRVSRFETFQELRNALAKKREESAGRGGVKIPEDVADQFRGVKILESKPNGGLLHDIAIVYARLGADKRGLLERQLNRLLGQYQSHAFPAESRKAA